MKSPFFRTLVVFGMVILLVPPGVIAQPTPVDVNIKPADCENPVNMKSNGALPVTISGTSTFNVS